MQPDKGILIKEITDGTGVEGLFLVKQLLKAETRAGKPYLMLTVMDNTGEMAARVWEDADRLAGACQPGSIIRLSAHAQEYRGVLQLKINTLEAADDPSLDMSLFLPATKIDIAALSRELKDIIARVTDAHLKNLLQSFINSETFMADFIKAPAAKLMHHAYIGGLLEHTVAVARLADILSGIYPSINRSLLISGAVLHDIGKIKEFSYELYPFDYTDQGRLVGHMVLGIEMIKEQIDRLPDFPDSTATMLKHLVLSHHGQYDFGSPALPMTLEAFILHFLDDLDSKINYFNKLGEQQQDEGYQWTEFQRHLERFLFIAGHSAEGHEDIPEKRVLPANGISSGRSGKQKKEQETPQINLFAKK